ncbi:MAG TPA: NAD(P)-binding protein [Nannocystis sp.]|jgi:uncharacterized protein with NAD-binding domain and iron-sulfur cluster
MRAQRSGSRYPVQPPRTSTAPRRKIAVLGAGLGSLSAVFALTEAADWQDRFEVTIYQIGWRLGGKARSGRNLKAHNRSEAFGHQLWWGCYDNAFAMLRRCYKELARPAGAPLATFKEAWKPAESVFFGTGLEDHDRLWPLAVGRNDATPGEGDLPPSVWDYVQVLLPWVLDCLPGIHPEYPNYATIAPLWQDQARSLLPALLRRAQSQGVDSFADFDPQRPDYDRLLRNPAAPEGPQTSRQRRAWALPLVVGAEQSLRALEAAGAREHHPNFLGLLDLALAVVRGIIHDGLDRHPQGFSAADDHDLRAWLRHHGASPASLATPVVTGFYDLLHAPALAAGASLRMLLRILLAHKGALYYTPQADLGEVVFAPLYQLLRRRGVRFRFFHKVKELRVEDDRICAIRIGRQVELDPGVGDYEPLINVKGLLCWPSRPLYAQIVLGDSPMIQALDFESAESPEIEEFTLRRGADFDDVILGIPAPALPKICAQLVDKYPAWQQALAHADSVAVQGAQLWLSPTWAQLAGHATPIHAGTLPGSQLPRWANRSPNVRLEQWPRELMPAAVCALDGPLPDPAPGQPGPGREQLRETVWTWLKSHPRRLWPEASLSATRELNWELLIDTNGRTGDHRLAAQHCWLATAATDRATLTLPGHTRHRLRAADSGVKNLLLAGDWLADCLGVAESAVLTGFQASRALCGHPQVIPGEADGVDLEANAPGTFAGASQSMRMAAGAR